MGDSGIFLESGGHFTVLEQHDYDSEDLLQFALAEHPEVLAGPTTSGGSEGRLILIRREMGVPSTDGGGNVWSLDHLFIDSDAIPVLVEVKRSSDTRIRREVVGQMLDYAANAVKYWPVKVLQDGLEKTAAAAGKGSELLLDELGVEGDPDEFWKKVETNLAAGRIRMLFVADKLPAELTRIIEFLNEQMNPAEVLGVELRQYVGGDHKIYVPHVVGRTTAAVDQKSGATGQAWDRTSFLEAAQDRCSKQELTFIDRLLSHVDKHGVKLSWGKGVTPGVGGWYAINGQPSGVWVLNAGSGSPGSRAYLVFYLGDVVKRTTPARVDRSAKILEGIPVMSAKIAEARNSDWQKYPSLFLTDIADDAAATQTVFDAIEDLIAAT